MPFVKSSGAFGRKQAPMPGPNSAAYKKIIAAQRSAAKKPRSTKSNKKAGRSTTAYSSLKTRQMLVERLKREIWASVLKINDAIIKLAMAGNFNAAKALFEFAGVYSLPEPDDECEAIAVAAAPRVQTAAMAAGGPDPVDAFFRSIGVASSNDEPEPSLAG